MRLATLVLVSALAASHAAADVVYFDNSAGTFQWRGVVPGAPPNATYLDLTLSPSQIGSPGPNRFSYETGFGTSSCTIIPRMLAGPGVAQSSTQGMAPLCGGGTTPIGLLARVFSAGQPIGSGATWVTSAVHGYARPATTSLLQLPGYIGCRFTIDSRTHYGWIHLTEWTSNGFTVGGWAYEDAPDTAITAGDTGGCRADFNGDGTVNSADFFDFLNAFFAGC